MCGRLRTAVTFVIGLLLFTACDPGPGSFGLPERPDPGDAPLPSSSHPRGHIAYQPPFLPIIFSIGTDFAIAVSVAAKLSLGFLGTVTVGALFRTGPVESVEFECGDRGEAESEFSQRPTISDGQDLPVLAVGDTAFDGGADTGEMLVRFHLGG